MASNEWEWRKCKGKKGGTLKSVNRRYKSSAGRSKGKKVRLGGIEAEVQRGEEGEAG